MIGTSIGPTLEMVRARREEIIRIAVTHGATNVRIFGSVARGEADADSDIDVLVDMTRTGGGLAFFGRMDDLQRDLEALLGHPVDVMDAHSLFPSYEVKRKSFLHMRARVIADAVPL